MPTLNWIGKDKVVNHHNDVPYSVLDQKEKFVAPAGTPQNSTNNRIIHGDNLAVLKSLLPEFEGEVNCIYIDPPYNTGNEGWVYNDNVNDPRITKWLGDVVGKEGEDLTRHDKWLCMMYPRLKLLHRLLAKDGVIFISIDDNEQANLKLICDEIFGESNFIANFIWEKRTNRENRKNVSSRHDYIICYAKKINSSNDIIVQIPMTEKALASYKNPDSDPRGLWKSDPATAQAGHATKSQFYILEAPNGKKHSLESGRCWLYTEQVMAQEIKDGKIWFGRDGNGVPRIKTYLNAKERGLTPETVIFAEQTATNEIAKKELKEVFDGDSLFETPKPSSLLEYLFSFSVKKNSIVLDSFAGSGTTAHAVLKLNAQDGGNRRFILCEMMDYADTITAERVRRVMTGYGEGTKHVAGLGGGFKYQVLGEPLFNGDYLNETVGIKKIRQYVAHSENIPIEKRCENSPVSPYLLGMNTDTSWIFYYEPERETVLDADFLGTLKYRANGLGVPAHSIIYADTCVLTIEQLERFGLRFKKIPRDIKRL